MKQFFRSHIVWLFCILCVAALARSYKLTTPLADWHSWRQTDTVSVSREFVKHPYDILHPHFQDLSDIPNGLNNVAGYRMVEFPIVNWMVSRVVLWQPAWNIVVVSRMFSIVFSLITIASIYVLVQILSRDRVMSVASALFFALTPYTVFYSRTALPEPAFVMCQVVSVTAFTLWIHAIQKKKAIWLRLLFAAVTIFFFAFALLFKPMAIFILPVFAVVAIGILGVRAVLQPELYVFALSLLPLWLWRHWITQFPSGIPASSWLFNGNGIRLRPAWWRWLFADRIGRLISGYWGVVFLSAGVLFKHARKFSLFDAVTLAWLASSLAYMVIIATGNVQHDYYQFFLTPILAILMARGVVGVLRLPAEVGNKFIIWPAVGLILALSTYFSWYEVSGYYNINNPAIVEAGAAVDKLTPPQAKVIAPYQGDTAFLFQTNRTGWPIGGRIEEKRQLGAEYYVSTAYDDEAKLLEKIYKTIEKTPDYILLDLKNSL